VPRLPPPPASSALRYWEPRRVPYNLVLLGVFVGALWRRWPALLSALDAGHLLELLGLAALANLCYSAAYLAELVAQGPGVEARWPRWRGALWVLGTALAAVVTLYWTLDEILPDLS
jgi:hypothetical protein